VAVVLAGLLGPALALGMVLAIAIPPACAAPGEGHGAPHGAPGIGPGPGGEMPGAAGGHPPGDAGDALAGGLDRGPGPPGAAGDEAGPTDNGHRDGASLAGFPHEPARHDADFAPDEAAPGARRGPDTVLVVTGRIAGSYPEDVVDFSRAALEALGLQTLRVRTPWSGRPITFEGVPLSALLRAVGADGRDVIVTTLDDYSATIPVADLAQYDPILALKRNGADMPVGQDGPLLIVYRYDAIPKLRRSIYYARSLGHVIRIDVE